MPMFHMYTERNHNSNYALTSGGIEGCGFGFYSSSCKLAWSLLLGINFTSHSQIPLAFTTFFVRLNKEQPGNIFDGRQKNGHHSNHAKSKKLTLFTSRNYNPLAFNRLVYQPGTQAAQSQRVTLFNFCYAFPCTAKLD